MILINGTTAAETPTERAKKCDGTKRQWKIVQIVGKTGEGTNKTGQGSQHRWQQRKRLWRRRRRHSDTTGMLPTDTFHVPQTEKLQNVCVVVVVESQVCLTTSLTTHTTSYSHHGKLLMVHRVTRCLSLARKGQKRRQVTRLMAFRNCINRI